MRGKGGEGGLHSRVAEDGEDTTLGEQGPVHDPGTLTPFASLILDENNVDVGPGHGRLHVGTTVTFWYFCMGFAVGSAFTGTLHPEVRGHWHPELRKNPWPLRGSREDCHLVARSSTWRAVHQMLSLFFGAQWTRKGSRGRDVPAPGWEARRPASVPVRYVVCGRVF